MPGSTAEPVGLGDHRGQDVATGLVYQGGEGEQLTWTPYLERRDTATYGRSHHDRNLRTARGIESRGVTSIWMVVVADVNAISNHNSWNAEP